MLSKPVLLKIFTTRAPGATFAICSPCDVLRPRVRPERSGFSGLVQSSRILPARSPALRNTSSAVFAGTVSTTTSANAMASGRVAALALGPAACNADCTFGSEASRTPNRTACPFFAQPVPKAPPTLPAPKTAIFIGHLLGRLDVRRGGPDTKKGEEIKASAAPRSHTRTRLSTPHVQARAFTCHPRDEGTQSPKREYLRRPADGR